MPPTVDEARAVLARIAAVRRPAVEVNIERRTHAEAIRARESACETCDGVIMDVEPLNGRREPMVCRLKTCAACRRNALIRRPNMSCLKTPPVWGPIQ